MKYIVSTLLAALLFVSTPSIFSMQDNKKEEEKEEKPKTAAQIKEELINRALYTTGKSEEELQTLSIQQLEALIQRHRASNILILHAISTGGAAGCKSYYD